MAGGDGGLAGNSLDGSTGEAVLPADARGEGELASAVAEGGDGVLRPEFLAGGWRGGELVPGSTRASCCIRKSKKNQGGRKDT